MTNFAARSTELELMDLPITDESEIFTNLKELEFINTLTGGPSLVYNTLKKILTEYFKNNPIREIHIADIGFGAGDMFVFLLENADDLPCKIRLTGVDLMPEAKVYALQMHPKLAEKVDFVTSDYQDWFAAGNKPDIVLASLFCHHLTDAQLLIFFENIDKNVKIAGIINDLHRHPLAYYGIKYLTEWFSKSRFTKNDAPLSVLRGFSRKELMFLLEKAHIKQYSVTWKWAFRFLIVV
jgi:2-polyprenyl-3-methyl-5-hydroxy-6-metoxy-1,4-benzoquinol methylase